MMVYAVMDYDYDRSWVRGMFATNELAEAYCVEEQRKKWQELVDRVGKPIPGTARMRFTFDGVTGESSSELIGQDFYEHPGSFEWWAKQRANQTDLQIEEHEVIGLVPLDSQRMTA